MPPNTLPPGWTGNDADHHVTVGTFRINVTRDLTYNPFTRRHQRTGGYRWTVTCKGGATLAVSASLGHPDAKDARDAGIDAVKVFIFEANQMIDWLRMHPVSAGSEPTSAHAEP